MEEAAINEIMDVEAVVEEILEVEAKIDEAVVGEEIAVIMGKPLKEETSEKSIGPAGVVVDVICNEAEVSK